MKKSLLLLAALLAACGGDESTDTSALQPAITQQEANARYRVKAGRELLLAPSYTNAEGARFTWTCDQETVCREAAYAFRRETPGLYYLTLRVENDYGAAEDELRVRVDALEAPCITLIEPVGGFTAAAGAELRLAPAVENGSTAHFRWTVDGRAVSDEAEYIFRQEKCGRYAVTFSAANDDGEDRAEFSVEVVAPERMPFAWEFPQTTYNVALGRTIRLKGWNPVNAFDAEYTWEVDGTEQQRGPLPEYRFEAVGEGEHTVTVTMRNSYTERTQALQVNVCPAEGRYYRPAGAASRASTVRVFEYMPAPGLWVSGYMYGPLFTAETMAEACAYAQSRLDINFMISLGAWGGYVVAGFDHSVDNSGGGIDLAIRGNPYSYQSEPGIVWVAQDENGDGLPNDTWYELAGSEYDHPETIFDYAVTYYQPARPQAAVVWRDNRGGGGTVDHNAYWNPSQSYYQPWLPEGQCTFYGTRLRDRSHVDASGQTVVPPFDWGYADNLGASDYDGRYCLFRLSSARTFDGRPAGLKYIDFVKIQTGQTGKTALLGETSTEVHHIVDYHLIDRETD